MLTVVFKKKCTHLESCQAYVQLNYKIYYFDLSCSVSVKLNTQWNRCGLFNKCTCCNLILSYTLIMCGE